MTGNEVYEFKNHVPLAEHFMAVMNKHTRKEKAIQCSVLLGVWGVCFSLLLNCCSKVKVIKSSVFWFFMNFCVKNKTEETSCL